MKHTWKRWLSLLLALSLVAAACGADDVIDDVADTATDVADAVSGDEEEAMDDEEEAMDDEEEAMDDDEGAMADIPAEFDLAGVCPSPLTIQTDWFPEAEHGALYQMVGDGYTIDSDLLTVTGPLWAPGPHETGIDIQVRAGGPAIGFAPPRVQMATDDSIHLGYTNTESQATAWADLPLISVVAPLERNPQMIMWDPATYPDVESIADLGDAGITVNIFAGGGFADYFVAQGIWSADQIDPSYDGSPARFVADQSIAQQGFASAEPYNYLNVFEEYGEQVNFQLLHDAGFEVYSQSLGVRPADFDDLSPCLELLVPIIQQSVVDFSGDPDRANAVIIDAVETFDSFWVYDEGIANFAVETMSELGLHGNGPDSTVGNMEAGRIQAIIDQGIEAGLDIPSDLTAEDMFTNEFIDESIGF